MTNASHESQIAATNKAASVCVHFTSNQANGPVPAMSEQVILASMGGQTPVRCHLPAPMTVNSSVFKMIGVR